MIRIFGLLKVGLLLLLFGPWVALAQAEVQDEPLLYYKSTHDLLPQDDYFWAAVYPDGMALVHYPAYMKKAGDYRLQLSPAEVDVIRLAIEQPVVQHFNPQTLKLKQKTLTLQADELFTISDHSYADIEINNLGIGKKSIRWANLQADAERYPQIRALNTLASLKTRVKQFVEHPTAVRVGE